MDFLFLFLQKIPFGHQEIHEKYVSGFKCLGTINYFLLHFCFSFCFPVSFAFGWFLPDEVLVGITNHFGLLRKNWGVFGIQDSQCWNQNSSCWGWGGVGEIGDNWSPCDPCRCSDERERNQSPQLQVTSSSLSHCEERAIPSPVWLCLAALPAPLGLGFPRKPLLKVNLPVCLSNTGMKRRLWMFPEQ